MRETWSWSCHQSGEEGSGAEGLGGSTGVLGAQIPLRRYQSQGQGMELCLGLGGKIASACGHFPWDILNFHQPI